MIFTETGVQGACSIDLGAALTIGGSSSGRGAGPFCARAAIL
jgi:hypothetical protein